MSDGLGLGVLEDESDGDHEQDGDYVMKQSASDSEDDFYCDEPETNHMKVKKAAQVRRFSLTFGWNNCWDLCTWQKTQRGDFRKAINEVRTAPPITGMNFGGALPAKLKRKEPSMDKQSKEWVNIQVNIETKKIPWVDIFLSKNADKRAKHTEPSGLLPGWKQKLAKEREKTIFGK